MSLLIRIHESISGCRGVWQEGVTLRARLADDSVRDVTPAEIDAAQAALTAAETQRELDRQDVQSALVRLTQIITATPPFTNAQRDAAIQDMAKFTRALIRLMT